MYIEDVGTSFLLGITSESEPTITFVNPGFGGGNIETAYANYASWQSDTVTPL